MTTIQIDQFGKRADGREFRTITKRKFQLRAAADPSKGPGTLYGYAAVFNVPSYDLGWGDHEVYEIIAPGAFSKCLADPALDVRCLADHETCCILGRTLAGTLRMKEDSIGLYYECDLPDTGAGNDIAVSVGRGDVTDNSFGFDTIGESWNYTDKMTTRTLTEIDIMEISPVCFPAYPGTSLSLRALADAKRTVVVPAGLDPMRAARLRLAEASLK